MPKDVQYAIFKDFLFKEFLFNFKRLFVFARKDMEGKIKRINGKDVRIQHTRYTWDHEPYRRFIYTICRNLEPRLESEEVVL